VALIRINPADHRAIYVQIVDEVRRAVVVGTLAANDALPSVRQLAEELGVNPNTVKQAYRELERLGVTYVERGTGTFVADTPAPARRNDRGELATGVAQRALNDATRHGLDVEELIDAIQRASKKNGRKP
jgi:GntR family transcriptional regulator